MPSKMPKEQKIRIPENKPEINPTIKDTPTLYLVDSI